MSEYLQEHIKATIADDTRVFIGIAGMAAHLRQYCCTYFITGDRCSRRWRSFKWIRCTLSTVQMPKGVPVATVAIGKAGAINAGHLAALYL